jgi:hypothetical protein
MKNMAHLMTMMTGVLLGIPNGSSNNWRNRRLARRTYRRVRCLVYRYEGLSDIINQTVTTHWTFTSGVFPDQGDAWGISQGGLTKYLDNIALHLEDHDEGHGRVHPPASLSEVPV